MGTNARLLRRRRPVPRSGEVAGSGVTTSHTSHAPRRRRIRGALWLLLLLVSGGAALAPRTVDAHAFLVRSDPPPGARLDTSPAALDLQFSEAVASRQVTVKTVPGTVMPLGPLERSQGDLVIAVPLPPLAHDIYLVSWQAVSADDGHVTIGEFAFAVGSANQLPQTLPVSTAGSAIAGSMAVASWLLLVPLFLAAGGVASEQFLWGSLRDQFPAGIPRLPVGWFLVLALNGGALQLLLLRSSIAGTGAHASWSAALTTRAGLTLTGQVALIAYGLWLLANPRLRSWSVLPVLGAVGLTSLRGHASAASAWWAMPANAVHLIAVALWVGGLGHLVLVTWRLRRQDQTALLSTGARRYATLALGLVVVVLASGVAEAAAQFQQPMEVANTTYGRVLLLKVALVAATLGIAFLARQRGLPSLTGGRRALLGQLTRIEGLFLSAVLAAAAVLANAPPPQPSIALATVLGPPPLREPVVRQATVSGLVTIYLAAGDDQLQVQVLAPSGDPVAGASYDLSGRRPDGAEFDVQPRSCGDGCVTSAFPWQAGTTALAVGVTTKTWGSGTAHFTVSWPPGPEASAVLTQMIQTMRALPSVQVTERVSPAMPGTGAHTLALTGADFMKDEVYAAGGASDIRLVPRPTGERALTLYISGSAMWYQFEIDAQNRLRQETIVTPGHLIERTFQYTGTAPPSSTSPTGILEGAHGSRRFIPPQRRRVVSSRRATNSRAWSAVTRGDRELTTARGSISAVCAPRAACNDGWPPEGRPLSRRRQSLSDPSASPQPTHSRHHDALCRWGRHVAACTQGDAGRPPLMKRQG